VRKRFHHEVHDDEKRDNDCVSDIFLQDVPSYVCCSDLFVEEKFSVVSIDVVVGGGFVVCCVRERMTKERIEKFLEKKKENIEMRKRRKIDD